MHDLLAPNSFTLVLPENQFAYILEGRFLLPEISRGIGFTFTLEHFAFLSCSPLAAMFLNEKSLESNPSIH